MRFFRTFSLFEFFYNTGIVYPAPVSLNYFWNYGVLSFISLILQILTGILLAMHFIPHADFAFDSVEHIMRDVNYGWCLRYIHSNGASFFFVVVYIHMFRGLFYGSYLYPREFLWCTGVVIMLFMIITAFLGYVLPWGQMSFWAATVITNLASTVPLIGNTLVCWLWGGFSVDNPTLTRFFSLHFLLPFVILGFVLLHILILHEDGSGNPLGLTSIFDRVSFYPYFIVKDLFGVFVFYFFLFFFIFFYPNFLGHTDNYIEANAMVTPAHIVPEWYFLPFYAILRSVPNKLFGVVLLLLSIVMLFILPFIVTHYVKVAIVRPIYKILFWCFFINCFLLGWLGGCTVETPFVELSQILTIFYFLFFFFVLIENFFVAKCLQILNYSWEQKIIKSFIFIFFLFLFLFCFFNCVVFFRFFQYKFVELKNKLELKFFKFWS